jgi:HD-GYP domain-containing protein (c-di-GMP phosphodiesterase class II)
VRHSHERWDGDGYPDGLSGDQIPLGSRIIFICDAYEAMTTDRAYRSAMPRAQALAELQHCAGTQFDPELVTLFAAEIYPLIGENWPNRARTGGATSLVRA